MKLRSGLELFVNVELAGYSLSIRGDENALPLPLVRHLTDGGDVVSITIPLSGVELGELLFSIKTAIDRQIEGERIDRLSWLFRDSVTARRQAEGRCRACGFHLSDEITCPVCDAEQGEEG